MIANVPTEELTEGERRLVEVAASEGCTAEVLLQNRPAQLAQEREASEQVLRTITRSTAYCLCVLAAVFLAFAYGFLIFSLENVLPHSARLAVALLVLGLSQATAWFACQRTKSRVRELLLFCCCLAFAAGVVATLIGTDMSSQSTEILRVDRLILLGLLPLAAIADSALVHLACALALWMCGYIEIAGRAPTDSVWPCHLLAMGLIPGFAWGYRKDSALIVGTIATLFAMWLLFVPMSWLQNGADYPAFAAPCLGAAFLFVAEWHHTRSGLAEAWRIPGLMLLGTALGLLGHAGIWSGWGHDLMEGTRRLTPEMLAPRLVCEAFLAISLLVAFVVPFRLYLARRREEQPPTVALAVLARQLWFPASMTVLVAFITLWHWSPQPWLCWGTLPIVASNLASLLLATYLVDTGVRRKQGYYIAAGVLCAARVLYLTCVMLDVDQHRLEVSCVLAAFGLSLSGLAVAWLRLEPARPDTLKLPVRSWEPPRSVERLLASCSTPSAILLLVAFAIQHAAIATNYSVRPLAQPAPAAARVN